MSCPRHKCRGLAKAALALVIRDVIACPTPPSAVIRFRMYLELFATEDECRYKLLPILKEHLAF